jgi:hypothetical protein
MAEIRSHREVSHNLANPCGKSKATLDRAMVHIKSVPYSVSLRWLFYRLLQDGLYHGKGDYGTAKDIFARARLSFYDGWHPSTLADEGRSAEVKGDGYTTPEEWLAAVTRGVRVRLDRWETQPRYVEVWFEAAAMHGQFSHYVNENVTLMPFGGDPSIPLKWAAARRLGERRKELDKEIVILYFGDDDPKGWQIPESAWADIRDWAMAEIEFVRIALNHGDGEGLGIPENPDHPGCYQWEALDDTQAAQLIGQVDDYLDLDAFAECEDLEEETAEKVKAKLREVVL